MMNKSHLLWIIPQWALGLILIIRVVALLVFRESDGDTKIGRDSS